MGEVSRNDFGALRQLLSQLQHLELGRSKNGKGSEAGKRDRVRLPR